MLKLVKIFLLSNCRIRGPFIICSLYKWGAVPEAPVGDVLFYWRIPYLLPLALEKFCYIFSFVLPPLRMWIWAW